MSADISSLNHAAREIRKSIIEMVTKAKGSHIGGALSSADILAALYFRILSVDPKNPQHPDRDRFILSKGHCCSALYAALAHRGFFPKENLMEYCSNGGKMWGHLSLGSMPGAEATTGSLGHGLAIGMGMAIALKEEGRKSRVFVLLSDGECDEGSVWESILLASHLKLDNLTAIVDYNKIQSFGRVGEVLDLEPFTEKWRSFGWAVKEISGHDMNEITEALGKAPFQNGKPSAVIAHTVKGKGVSYMEDRLEWHYKTPDEGQYRTAMQELQGPIKNRRD